MAFFKVFTLLLETLFISTDPRPETFNNSSEYSRSSDGDDDEDDDEHFNNSSDDKAALEAAFKYFEIDSPEEATREAVKKKFRRLSLVHHPDRNNQSEESVKEMQRINRFYELLEQEFDEREGKDSPQDSTDTPEEPTADDNTQPDPNDPSEPGISQEERKRRRKVRKRQRKKQRQQARKHEMKEQEKRRQEMEKEMHREWEEARRKAEEFQKQQKKTKQENERKVMQEHLDTEWGRCRARETWKSKIEAIEKGEDSSETRATDKPPNSIMDCSTDDIAIALRLGAPDVAIELIQENIQSFMAYLINGIIRRNFLQGNLHKAPTEEDQLDMKYQVYRSILLEPLDDDGNHVLHYAAYYEDNEMLSYLTSQAHRLGHFAEYITSTNDHGSNIMDFCVGSSNSGFKNRVDAFYKEGRKAMQEKEEAEAREKDVVLTLQYYFQQLRQHANFGPALFSAYGILLGKYIFSARWYETVLTILFTKFMQHVEDGSNLDLYGMLVLSHCWWFLCKSVVVFTWNLFPWWLLLGVILVAGCVFPLSSVIFVVPTVIYAGCTIIADRVLDLFSSIVPPPKNQRLAMILDVIVLCSSILLLRNAWTFVPTWNLAEPLDTEAVNAFTTNGEEL